MPSSVTESIKPKQLTQSQILSASKKIKTYIDKNKKLPNYVTINNHEYSMEEYMYFSSVAIDYMYNNKKSAVTVKYNINSPNSPSGSKISGALTKEQYKSYAVNAYKYINTNNRAPNYVSSKLGNMQFQTFVYANSKILDWSKKNGGKLPNTLTMEVANTDNINKYMPKYTQKTSNSSTTQTSNVSSKSASMTNIFEASNRAKKYVESNNTIPSTITVGSDSYSINDFLYLLSKAIVNKNSNLSSNVVAISTTGPSSPSGNNKVGKIYKDEFITISKNLVNYYSTNKKAPNYVATSLGNLQYQSTIYLLSLIGAYIHNNKNAIPNYVDVTVTSSSKVNGIITSQPSNPSVILIGSDNSKGKVEFLGAYGNTKSNVKIAYIIGMHPLENKVHTDLFNSLVNKNNSLKYCYYIYRITVTQNPNDFDKGRMNGQTLARDYILPHIKNKKYNLIIDVHSNQGTVGGNYKKTNFIFAPLNNIPSKVIANAIIRQIPELTYYYPESQSSPPYLTNLLVQSGILTIIYETYMYETESVTHDLINKLINKVNTYIF